MAPLKLHGVPFSTCTARVRACLEEKNVEYEICPVDLGTGAHKRPNFISNNPFESRAVNNYIAHKYKDQGTDLLQHGNLDDFAKVLVGCEVESQQFNPTMGPFFFQHLYFSSTRLGFRDYYTLTDLNHLPYIAYIMKTPHAELINSRPHVKAWWEVVSSRPTSVKVSQGLTLGSSR
ncbi:hypothetical protein MKW92_003303 [Papaver armeniacum]|nr:hypothetical protein MKW92_003303 [Papaver armeniacum]